MYFVAVKCAPPTNIVLLEVEEAERFVARLAERGVLALARSARVVRFVTHRGVGRAQVRRAVAAIRGVLDPA